MVAFCAGMREAMEALAVFADVACPGVAPCLILVMVLAGQTAAIRLAIQASTAQDDQATARNPVSFTGAGKSWLLTSLYRVERASPVWASTALRRISEVRIVSAYAIDNTFKNYRF